MFSVYAVVPLLLSAFMKIIQCFASLQTWPVDSASAGHQELPAIEEDVLVSSMEEELLFSLDSQDEDYVLSKSLKQDSVLSKNTEEDTVLAKSREQDSVLSKSREKNPVSLKRVKKKVISKSEEQIPSRQVKNQIPSNSREENVVSSSRQKNDRISSNDSREKNGIIPTRQRKDTKSSNKQPEKAKVSSRLGKSSRHQETSKDTSSTDEECSLFKSPEGHARKM